MNSEYIITNQEIMEKGLTLDDYALSSEYIPAIINLALDIAITRCCYLNDNFLGEYSIEEELTEKPYLITSFKKLQYRIIWNLLFTATDDPVDQYIDAIIVHELGWGKINGFQKGLWYKNY